MTEDEEEGELFEATVTYRYRSHSVSRAATAAESATRETQWVSNVPEVTSDGLDAEVESVVRVPEEEP